jgi:hypothetical protein
MTSIEQKVMASVGAVYIARSLVGVTALKLYVALAALWTLGRLVWVERVFENFTSVGAGGTLHFLASAVLNTELAVQVTLALFLGAGLWLLRDLTRGIPVTNRFS